MAVTVNGREVATARHELEWPETYVDLGPVASGDARLAYTSGGWRPGARGESPFPYGPLVVAPDGAPRRIVVAPQRAHTLCGRRLDWIETLG
jgi:hypothetical protein